MSAQTLIVVFAAAALVYVVRRWLGTWMKYRGQRVISCPENQKPAGVLVDARHAAATSFGSAPDLRLNECSRWPEHSGCGQECLRQIEASPDGCLVRGILTKWYEGKACVYCGKPIGEIHWVERKPALLVPAKTTMDWDQVAPQDLSATLASAMPVCFACHVANTMVRQHPELVVDRSRPA